jgi:hypothetical protein
MGQVPLFPAIAELPHLSPDSKAPVGSIFPAYVLRRSYFLGEWGYAYVREVVLHEGWGLLEQY